MRDTRETLAAASRALAWLAALPWSTAEVAARARTRGALAYQAALEANAAGELRASVGHACLAGLCALLAIVCLAIARIEWHAPEREGASAPAGEPNASTPAQAPAESGAPAQAPANDNGPDYGLDFLK